MVVERCQPLLEALMLRLRAPRSRGSVRRLRAAVDWRDRGRAVRHGRRRRAARHGRHAAEPRRDPDEIRGGRTAA